MDPVCSHDLYVSKESLKELYGRDMDYRGEFQAKFCVECNQDISKLYLYHKRYLPVEYRVPQD